MGVLFLFLDGVGLGLDDPAVNPFAAAHTPYLHAYLGGQLTRTLTPSQGTMHLFSKLDARLGVAGLPQSATGQATLLTGKNAALRMQRHYGPLPGPTIKTLLAEGTLFSEIKASGGKVVFANGYPKSHLEALLRGERKMHVPLVAASYAQLRLHDEVDVARHLAVPSDLSGKYASPKVSPLQLGRRLAELAVGAQLTFFDVWQTDLAGHRWDMLQAVDLCERFDSFLQGVVAALSPATTLVVTSDHGNLEDKGTRSHTLNQVPLLVIGPAHAAFSQVNSLLDIAPAIRRALMLA